MINFYFTSNSQGFTVTSENQRVKYDCRNRTKGFAWEEAVSFVSSFQGSCLHDRTKRQLNTYKWMSDLPVEQVRATLTEKENGNEIRLRAVLYQLEYTVYEVEVWGV